VETPPEEIVLDSLFYLGGVPFPIVNVLAVQLRKSCHLRERYHESNFIN
jgi:hypothetical protein